MVAKVVQALRRLLRLGPQAETHPAIARKRLEEAHKKYDQYVKEHNLNILEDHVLLTSIHSQLATRYSGHQDYFDAALAQLEAYRRRQAQLRARPEHKVAFVDQSRWRNSWTAKRWLAILLAPEIKTYDNEVQIRSALFSPWGIRLALAGRLADFDCDPDTFRPADIRYLDIYRRQAPRQWKGSFAEINESDSAEVFMGEHYMPTTHLSCTLTLACATFDHLTAMMERHAPDKTGADHLLLACGFVPPRRPIPRPRPVKPRETIADRGRLQTDAPLMWFEIGGVFKCGDGPGMSQIRSFARWMAVEA